MCLPNINIVSPKGQPENVLDHDIHDNTEVLLYAANRFT